MAKTISASILLCAVFLSVQPAKADSYTFDDLTHSISNTSFLETAFTVNWTNGTTDTIQVCSSAMGATTPCNTAFFSIFSGRAPSALNCLSGFDVCSATLLAPSGGATVTSATAGDGSTVSIALGGDLFISGLGNEQGIVSDAVSLSFQGGLPSSYTVDFTSYDDVPTPILCLGRCTTPTPTPEPSSLLQLGVGLFVVAGALRRKLFRIRPGSIP